MTLIVENLPLFWLGLRTTLSLAFFTLLASTVIGVVLGVLATFPARSLRILVALYVETFRDIPLIVTNLVQLVFFATPILWRADTLPADRSWVILANPFHYLIDNLREPMLGHAPALGSWLAASAITAANLLIGIALYARYRARIAYWL